MSTGGQNVPSPVQPSPAVAPEKVPAAPPAAVEPPAPAVQSPSPEPVGSLIGEEPKEEPSIIGEAKELPKEPPKVAEPPGPPKDGKYETFKLPEGVELDATALADASKFMAEELKLPQDRAQALVDFHVKALQTEAEAPYRLWEKTQRDWQEEVKADPVIGGDNLPNVKVRIAKLLDEFGDPKVKEALAYTGAGNNPAIIRTFYKLAEKLTEGTFVPSGGASQGPRSAEQVFYPSMFEGKK
jgi:hypothetical protein